jgi:hypothetical protein
VTVLNSGAFHRTIDEEGFLKRVKAKGLSTGEGLRKLTPEDLPPCYTAVIVNYEEGHPKPAVQRWIMTEEATGKLVGLGDPICK